MVYQSDGEIRVWSVEDRNGDAQYDLFDDFYEAKREAKDIGGILIECIYHFHDSETVEDFRPHCVDCNDLLSDEDENKYDDQCESCWKEENEPAEDDITTEDHQHFYQYGKMVLSIDGDVYDWRQPVRDFMDQQQFWPTVWVISDHGNAEAVDMES